MVTGNSIFDKPSALCFSFCEYLGECCDEVTNWKGQYMNADQLYYAVLHIHVFGFTTLIHLDIIQKEHDILPFTVP